MRTKLLSMKLSGVKFATPDTNIFSGYASVFNEVDSYGDSIVPGAYADTIKNRERPILMRWNHWDRVIGKWTEFAEDDIGLKVTGELTPGHSLATDVAASMRHKAVDGLSIGYYVHDEERNGVINLLKKIELIEISVVEEPADNFARISTIKSAIHDAETMKEIESILRDAGRFSKADAMTLINRIKSMSHSDYGQDETISIIENFRSQL